MSFSNSDSFNLERIANYLERIAAADEERNRLLEAEMVARAEQASPAAARPLLPDPVWRDLPEPTP